jgi:hypothetical protein
MALHFKKLGNIEAARSMLGTSKSMQSPIDSLLTGQAFPTFILPPPPSSIAATIKKTVEKKVDLMESQGLLCQRLAGFHLR